jgi:hypothetical protein
LEDVLLVGLTNGADQAVQAIGGGMLDLGGGHPAADPFFQDRGRGRRRHDLVQQPGPERCFRPAVERPNAEGGEDFPAMAPPAATLPVVAAQRRLRNAGLVGQVRDHRGREVGGAGGEAGMQPVEGELCREAEATGDVLPGQQFLVLGAE